MAKNNNTLVFNGLMQGMSWDQIKEAKDEIKRHQGEKPPTRKDILTNWIIGKDYMLQQQGNTFQFGGGYSSWLSQFKKDNPLTDGRTNYSWGELSKGKLEDSFSNGNGLNSALGIAGTALDWTKGFIDSVNSIDNSAQVNDAKYIAGQQINFGDNASLMNTQSNLQYADTNTTAADVGGHSFGQSAMNVGKDIFSGATTGLSVGGPWGAVIGGAAGLAKGVIQEIVTNNKAKEAADTANLISSIANDQINQRMGYASDKSQQLAVLNQLQNMAKNGGKLKKSHKFSNGGLLNNYFYGLDEINAGGSHEENPNEGVVVSYAPDGLPNKVEEGETIHNDYVYSKRLEANKKVLENNLLDEKYEGKSFADISKKLTEDRKKRPNDPISVRTNEENLNRLQGAQEELKLDNKTKEVKRFLGNLNNDQLNALQQEMMDEYEAYAEQQAKQQEQEDQAYQEEQAAQEGMFGRGGHLKQGEVSSSISRLRPVCDAEGNIVGWKNPYHNFNEKVLNLSGYNPNYEGAQIYADDRNWLQRNIVSPWNTWWNNLPPEFSWAVRNLTPVGYVDAAINGDTEALIERALFEGLLSGAKGAFKGFKEARAASKAEKVAAQAKRQKAASTLKGKSKADNVVEMKPTQSAKGLEEEVSSKIVDMEGKEIPSTEAAKQKSWLRRNWKPATAVGGGLGLGIWGFNKLTKEKNPPYNLLIDPNAYNEFLDEENNRSSQQQTTKDINTIQHNTGDTSGDTLWIEGIPYNMNTGENYEKGGHLFQKRGHIIKQSNVETPVLSRFLYQPSEYKKEEQRNDSNNSNVSTKDTPVKPKSASTTKSTTASPTVQKTPNNNIQPMDFSPLWMQGDIGLQPRNLFTIENEEEQEYSNDPLNIKYLLNQNGIYPKEPEVIAQKAKEREAEERRIRELKGNNKNSTNYLSYLRYAPILGSLGQALSDTLGLTNQPDYSNIDMYRRAVDSIGGVNFVPIGGYQQYTPIDKEYIANQQLAQSAAYNRSLNNVNPVGSYILGLINDAKVRDQIGDMYINAAAQDQKDKLAVAEYNRGIDITNARNSLAAQSENARLRAQRANEYQSIANMMNTERNTAEAARAVNYQGLFTNIGNLGTDEMNRTMVNRNPALFYGVNLDGSIYFKNTFWGLSKDTQNELIEMLKNEGYTISE